MSAPHRRHPPAGAVALWRALPLALLLAAGGPARAQAPPVGPTQAPPAAVTQALPAAATAPAAAPEGEAMDAPPPAPLPWPLPADAAASEPAGRLFGAAPGPAAGPVAAIGGYARGCLAGAVRLADDGPGWQAMRPARNRHFGTPDLVAYLTRLAADAPAFGYRGILIGDMSQPRGGPMATGHASHQTGLDTDLWYDPMPGHVQSRDERETRAATSLLLPGARELDPAKWSPALGAFVRRAARDPAVERVFVHPALKAWLCAWPAAGEGGGRGWLARVRPYWGHDDHLHVRLACPPGMAACRPQAPPPPGDGCDATLAWWFTDEPWTPAVPPPPPKPPVMLADLPPACAGVLAAP
ncbi:penicillin-insensitive murein endopeptidase [Pseudoxanthobacter sp.]|uniref:penicillin-insensitive murein endopeptidase n=1 Tax=Pseudoxanthobacter sp. TaxID=1925742 RepID=UPI002FE1358F